MGRGRWGEEGRGGTGPQDGEDRLGEGRGQQEDRALGVASRRGGACGAKPTHFCLSVCPAVPGPP